jgi:hypothetical protein
MKNPTFLVQVLPILTISICLVFFIIYKILSRVKSQARGHVEGAKSADIKLVTQAKMPTVERLKLACPALIERSQGFTRVGIKEITLSGAFVTCPKPLPVGDIFQIKIIFEPEKSLTLKADVLWNNDNVPSDQVVSRGMKIRFLQLSPDERLFLKDILAAS